MRDMTPEKKPSSQEKIIFPETLKRGRIVPAKRGAVFFDRTQQIKKQCGPVSKFLRFEKLG